MKALSLLQPWATAIAAGLKTVETRSWSTPYRGPLAIHASKKFTRGDFDLFMATTDLRSSYIRTMRRALRRAGYTTHDQFPIGCIIAVAELVACHSTGPGIDSLFSRLGHPIPGYEWMDALSEEERAFGDYGPHRWAWFLTNVRPLDTPIPTSGALGLWDFPDDVLNSTPDQTRLPL